MIIFTFVLSIAIIYPLRTRLRLIIKFIIPLALVAIVNLQFTHFTTQILSNWLTSLLQNTNEKAIDQQDSLVIILGRGQRIAEATTDKAIGLYKSGKANLFYISGDRRATADLLVKGGIPAKFVYGDYCARTTWENALLTSRWVKANHLGKQIILLTDPWQLPRATKSFERQGMTLIPVSVMPKLADKETNFLAKREALGTFVYILLGRI